MGCLVAFPACSRSSNDTADQSFRERYLEYLAGSSDHSAAREVEIDLARRTHDEVRACMEQHGFDYPAPDFEKTIHPAADIENLDWTERYGFGVTLQPPSEVTPDPLTSYILTLTQAERDAFDRAIGRPGEGGCQDDGDAAARKSLKILDLDRSYSAMPSPLEQPEMLEAETTWRDCTAAVGVTAHDLPSLIADLAGRAQTLAGSPDQLRAFHREEIDIAVATFDCNVARNSVLASVTTRLLLDATS